MSVKSAFIMLASLLCAGAPAGAQVVLSANFDGTAQGFTYLDDAFRGTAQAATEAGTYLSAGGFSGGGLQVKLAGTVAGSFLNMSGGWRATAALPGNTGVQLSFRYRLTLTPAVDADESGQVLVSLGSTLVGAGGNDYVAQIAGGPGTSTGWQTFTTTLAAMPSGPLTVTVGGFMNKKTTIDEEAEILIDDFVITALPQAAPVNGLARELWNGIAGKLVTDLTSSAPYPSSPSWKDFPASGFEMTSAFGDNFGERIRGYLTPPTTGAYTFWIAADDAAELWLSPNANPTGLNKIATVSLFTTARQWTKYPEQQSVPVTLTAGQKYYVEVLHKEGTGGDNLAVGWQGPGMALDAERPIPLARLTPWTGVVVTPPAITVQPAPRTVNQGQTATFTVTATGTAPLAYQWMRNGVSIPGATSASYTTPATVPADDGAQFSVTVSNSAGSATSAPASLGVVIIPGIITHPASQTINLGSPVTFGVVASGTAPFTYAWARGGVVIPGATADTYTIPSVGQGDDGATFNVTVSNAAGGIGSNQATLTVRMPPTIIVNPSDRSVNVGQTASFSVTAIGGAPLTYQWRNNGINIPGATASTYVTPPTVAGDNGHTFDAVVSNAAGSATSGFATLTVIVPPAVVTGPQSVTVDAGQTATFSVTASGTGPLGYQWQKNGANLAGASAASYTTPPTVPADNGAQFRVVITNAAGQIISPAATLTVRYAPIITGHPANRTVTEGQAASFSVVADGTAPLSYQWRKGGSDIPSATGSTYTIPTATLGDAGSYDAVVMNALGSATSNPAALIVNPAPPVITVPPAPVTVIEGATATFTVTVTSSTTPTFQWRRNSTPISGATSQSYTTPATVPGDDGSSYSVAVTNGGGTTTSAGAVLTVRMRPVITTQPAPKTVKAGQTATFSVTAAGSPPLSYQWRRNGVNIAGALSAAYTTPVTAFGDNALFDAVVTSPYGSATSNTAALTVLRTTPQSRKVAISGELVDAAGNPVGYPAPVTVDATVRLMDAATGGTALYTEDFRAANQEGVRVENGLFVARLGEGTTTGDLQAVITANPQLWVEITVDDGTPDVLLPRTPLTAAAYALGGVPAPAPAAQALQGEGNPTTLNVQAATGATYVNTDDNSTWFKLSTGWKRMD